MDERDLAIASCPYCGEQIELLLDWSAGKQSYIEDCEVCCRPIHLRISFDHDGNATIDARQEDD